VDDVHDARLTTADSRHMSPSVPGLRGQATTLVVGQAWKLASELVLEHLVLLDQVLDDLLLLAMDPA